MYVLFVTAVNEDGYMDLQGYDNTQQLLIGKCICKEVLLCVCETISFGTFY